MLEMSESSLPRNDTIQHCELVSFKNWISTQLDKFKTKLKVWASMVI